MSDITEELRATGFSVTDARNNVSHRQTLAVCEKAADEIDRLRSQVAEQETRAAQAEQALAGLRVMADRVFNALTAWKRDAADWDDNISREIDVMVCEALAGYQPDDAKLLSSAVDARLAEQEATIRRLQDGCPKDAETFLERVREAVGVRMASSLRDPASVLVNHLRGLINVDSVLEYYRAREAEATSSPTPPNTQPACANGGESKPEDAR